MQLSVRMSLKEKNSRKWANGQNIYDSEIKLTPVVHLPVFCPCPWAIYMYMTIIVKQVCISEIYIPDLR